MNENNNKQSQNQISPDDLFSFQRSKLSIERTILASERTLLSFIRTSLGFFAASVSLIQFFENKKFVLVGYFFIPLGFLFLLFGAISYYRTKKSIKASEFIK